MTVMMTSGQVVEMLTIMSSWTVPVQRTHMDNHASLSPENCKYEATNKNQRRDFSNRG